MSGKVLKSMHGEEVLLEMKIKAAFINLFKYVEQKRRKRLSRIQLITDAVGIHNPI